MKLIRLALSLLFISLMSFSVVRLIPGDPVATIIGERGASEERIQEIRKNLGLDQSIVKQFFLFTGHAFRGEFGESIVTKQPVWSEFKVLWPATLELALMSLSWSVIVGLILGILAAVKRNSIWDYSAVTFSTFGFAMPLFWLALLAIYFFSVHLKWLPVSGRISVEYDVPIRTGLYLIDTFLNSLAGVVKSGAAENWSAFWSALHHAILPSFVLGTISLALIVRVTRSSFIDIQKEDYIRTARAKGLGTFAILFKHVFKNALPQILTALGLAFGHLLTGAIMTETIFSWPGLGRWMVKSIEARDYPSVQAGVFYSMLIIVLINFATDELIKRVNPRVRAS